MEFTIPGLPEPLVINTLILDLNGTLAVHGKVLPGVSGRIEALREKALKLFLFTGDTHGNAGKIAQQLGLEVRVTKSAQAKADEAMKLDPMTCAAIGNGKIDEILFKTVRLAIVTIQAEGAHRDAVAAAELQVMHVNDALDYFLKPDSLIATMRR